MQPDLIETTGSWLKQFDWHLFASLTFRFPVTQNACHYFVREFVHDLGREGGVTPYAVWMPEKTLADDRWHAHALIGADGRLTSHCSKRSAACGAGCATHLWRHGYAEIRRYDPARGAIFYMLKDLGRPGREMQIEGTPLRANSLLLSN